uniref:BPTI/Kunitz inhibitor domain-containing protein n=1 Tax=Dendroctonus ponderosae TaxID=77166 RepID=A0AAR5PJG2_DENPD
MQQNLECWVDEKCEDYEEMEDFPDCPERPWTDWSPCSATCDKGFKERYKLSLKYTGQEAIYGPQRGKDNDAGKAEDPCERRVRETVECFERACDKSHKLLNAAACSLPMDVGACKSNIDRWYFDAMKNGCEIFSYSGCEGNQNNFNTLEQCQTLCAKYQIYVRNEDDTNGSFLRLNDQKVNCEMSKWTEWTQCLPSNGECGPGYKIKYRHIQALFYLCVIRKCKCVIVDCSQKRRIRLFEANDEEEKMYSRMHEIALVVEVA